jgi:hypothetical protein
MKSLRSLLVALLTVGVISAAVAFRFDSAEDADKLLAPLGEGAKYWKGNLHTHTLWSDGDDFPEMVADWYRRHGYHFLCLSDHNLLSEGQRWVAVKGKEIALGKYVQRFGEAWVERRIQKEKVKDKDTGGTQDKETPQVRLKPLAEFRSVLDVPGRFHLIQGEEITHKFAKSPIHMNGINLRDKIVPVDGGSVTETIRANIRSVQAQEKKTGIAMFTSLNHPNYGWGVRAEDIARSEELRYFEIYNGHPDVNNYGDKTRPSTDRMWDIALALRLGKYRLPIIYGMATDDAHRYHKFGVGSVNPGRGWIMVKAPHLTPEAIVRSVQDGDFYLSTGVVLDDVKREGDRLSFRIRGDEGVKYKTQFVATTKDAPLDPTPLAEGEKEPAGTRSYSDAIGKVVAETESLTPSYRFAGNELYVRARITSTKPHPNPFKKGDVEVAWTQPVEP